MTMTVISQKHAPYKIEGSVTGSIIMEKTFVAETKSAGPDNSFSKSMRGGGKTYFFDVRESKNGKRYLQITESRFVQNGERQRNTLFIFPEYVQEFQQTFGEAVSQL